MIRCLKTEFFTTKSNLDRLFECNRISAEIYNSCLKIAKEYSLANNGKWIGKTQLQKELKDKYPLHSQSVQAVCHKYLFSRDAAFKARKAGLKTNIHTIASYTKSENALIITGRKMRSVNRLRNKKVAELQRLMSKCKKGSKQWKKYSKAKQYVLYKSDAQIKDILHKTTKNFVDFAVNEGVKEVVIGKVEGVQRNTKGKKTKKVNQKLSNWNFGKLKDYLKYKLESKDITLNEIDESYTSQTCPVCSRKKKISTRNYKCVCSYTAHRDIHGARNILSKHLYKDIRYIGDIKETKYLRIA